MMTYRQILDLQLNIIGQAQALSKIYRKGIDDIYGIYWPESSSQFIAKYNMGLETVFYFWESDKLGRTISSSKEYHFPEDYLLKHLFGHMVPQSLIDGIRFLENSNIKETYVLKLDKILKDNSL